MKVRLGTRASGLARAHSSYMTDRLEEAARESGIDLEVVVVPVTAEGTSRHGRSTEADPAILLAALRVALLSGECDIAVHALEDVPIEGHPDLSIAAILARRDPRDALCTDGPLLGDLPVGSRVAADSPRRTSQILALRPSLTAVETTGSIDFQLERLSGGEYEALVIGKTDLDSVGRPHSAVQVFGIDEVIPAAGQGCLIVETRSSVPAELKTLLRALDDAEARSAVIAERSVLEVLGADKKTPVGVHATIERGFLRLRVRALNRDGTLTLTDVSEASPEHARSLGRNAGLVLLGRGGGRLIKS
jgi:hydroxymethylbilane synthase